MSRTNGQALGAMHPILFFVLVYGISLFLAFFICSAVYNSLHPVANGGQAAQQMIPENEFELTAGATATVMR